jgi:hypothetical protein
MANEFRSGIAFLVDNEYTSKWDADFDYYLNMPWGFTSCYSEPAAAKLRIDYNPKTSFHLYFKLQNNIIGSTGVFDVVKLDTYEKTKIGPFLWSLFFNKKKIYYFEEYCSVLQEK